MELVDLVPHHEAEELPVLSLKGDVEEDIFQVYSKSKEAWGKNSPNQLEILHMKFGYLGGNLELHNDKLHKL